jgi:hypothetical protein
MQRGLFTQHMSDNIFSILNAAQRLVQVRWRGQQTPLPITK